MLLWQDLEQEEHGGQRGKRNVRRLPRIAAQEALSDEEAAPASTAGSPDFEESESESDFEL